MFSEKISILPDGVFSLCAAGSRRKSANGTGISAGGGISITPCAQNCSNGGSATPPGAAAWRACSYMCTSQPRSLRPSSNAPPKPSRAASSQKTSKSLRDCPIGAIACRIANQKRSKAEAPMSSRSTVVVIGSTMSARRAAGVHHESWTTTVSGRAQPRISRLRSCCWWKGLPPHQ